MTRISETQKIIYAGNGSTTVFAIPFGFFTTNSFVQVWLRDLTDLDNVTEALKTNPTHYSISGSNLTMVTAPAADEELLIRCELPLTQPSDYIAGGQFLQETHELNLDKIVAMIQQVHEMARRSLKFQTSSSKWGDDYLAEDPSTDSVLVWTDTGIANGPDISTIEAAIASAAAAAASAASAAASATAAAASAASASASATAAADSAADAAASAAISAAAGTEEQEEPVGAVDSINDTYTLALTPILAASVKLYLDGIFMRQGTDYTISGDTITMIAAPITGQTLDVVYRH